MANYDRPRGFEPKGEVLRSNVYVAGGNIYPGDMVKRDANGKVVVVDDSAATYSSACLGVAAGKAETDDDVTVFDHPDQLFVAQADDATIDAQTDINLNYSILAADPDTTYKLSRMEIDASTGATTATLPLKLLGIDKAVNNALGAQVDCIVKINNHELAGGTGTAGV